MASASSRLDCTDGIDSDDGVRMEAASLVEQAKKLDLSKVTARVAKENPSWSDEKLLHITAEYKRWLVLCSLPAKGALGMCSSEVDEVWHAHILHTQ